MYTEIVQQIHSEFNNSCEKFRHINSELPDIGLNIQDKILKCIKKYPLHKIIPKNDVLSICKKYGLVLASINRYAGFIPEKNINDLKNFNNKTTYYSVDDEEYLNRQDAEKYNEKRKNWLGIKKPGTIKEIERAGDFFICAPRKEFIMNDEDDSRIDYTAEADPIILFCPYNDFRNEVMVIVTAWGEEASDEMVVNQKMN